MIMTEEKKELIISRHILIGEEFDSHLLTPYCKCEVQSILHNKIYSEALEDFVIENVYLHSQLVKHEISNYVTMTFGGGNQLDNKTLKVI